MATSGVRVELSRTSEAEARLVYKGIVTAGSQSRHHACVLVGDDAMVSVELTPGDVALAERVRLIVRTAVKHSMLDGLLPPRKINRWRAGSAE